MKKGVIIINHQYGAASKNITHKINRFKEEFSKLDTKIDVLENDGSLAIIKGGDIVLNMAKYDFCIYLDKDKYLARIIEKAGMPIFNRPSFIELCDDKMFTHIRLANLGFKMPKTIPGPLVFSNHECSNEEVLNNVLKEISFPLLIKGVYGSLGLNMEYVSNKDEFNIAYDKMKDQPLLFQEYIKSSYGKSLRCLVVDHKLLGAFERYNPNDYRSNFHEGASSKPFSLPDNYIGFINRIIDELDIEYAGIDLLFGEDNEPILCEINSNAFFKEFENVTHINVAKEFATMVLNKINR